MPDPMTGQPGAVAPLTFEQDRYERFHRGGPPTRNVHHAFEVLGRLDDRALRSALDAFVRRHDAVRAVLVHGPDGPVGQRARPLPAGAPTTESRNVTAASAEQFGRFASVVLSRDCVAPWSEDDQGYRFRLLRFDDRHHAVIATFRRLMFDGRAHEVFAREVWRDYATLVGDGTPPGEAPSFHAAARRQRDAVTARRRARALEDRRDRTAFAAANRWLPPPGAPATADGTVDVEFGAAAVAALRSAGAAGGHSLQQWVVGSFARAAAAAAGLHRLTVTTTVDTRSSREADLVGMFAGTTPLALTGLSDGLPEVVARVRRQILAALRHQCLTADEVDRAGSGLPPVPRESEVRVYLRSFAGPATTVREVAGLRVTGDAYPLRNIVAVQEPALSLDCYDFPDRLRLRLGYRGDVVGRPLAESIAQSVVADVTGVAGLSAVAH